MSEAGFTDDDYDVLRERETLVQDLLESPGWQALTEIANKQIGAQKRRLLSGDLTPDAYVKVAYQIRGAEFLLNLPSEISGIVNEYRRQIAERQEAERDAS